MNPIRPNLAPTVQPNAPAKPVDAARSAAQRAFFEIAMGKAAASAPAQTQAAAATQAVAAAAGPTRAAPAAQPPSAGAPTRVLRPGSLLDIRV